MSLYVTLAVLALTLCIRLVFQHRDPPVSTSKLLNKMKSMGHPHLVKAASSTPPHICFVLRQGFCV